MERARVLCPSISFAAHVTGATLLVAMPLLFPRLPAPAQPGFGAVVRVDTMTLASLAGPPAGSPIRPRRVRVESPRAITAPAFVPPRLDTAPAIEIDGPPGIPGLPDDVGVGNGSGLCLSNCGPTGSGEGAGVGSSSSALPVVDETPRRPVRLSVLHEPRKLRHVAPVYPPLALATRVQGRVVLDCVIDEDGRVSSVAVLRGNPLLDAAAADAVRQWRYTPTLLNGVPVSVLLTVTVDFTLR